MATRSESLRSMCGLSQCIGTIGSARRTCCSSSGDAAANGTRGVKCPWGAMCKKPAMSRDGRQQLLPSPTFHRSRSHHSVRVRGAEAGAGEERPEGLWSPKQLCYHTGKACLADEYQRTYATPCLAVCRTSLGDGRRDPTRSRHDANSSLRTAAVAVRHPTLDIQASPTIVTL